MEKAPANTLTLPKLLLRAGRKALNEPAPGRPSQHPPSLTLPLPFTNLGHLGLLHCCPPITQGCAFSSPLPVNLRGLPDSPTAPVTPDFNSLPSPAPYAAPCLVHQGFISPDSTGVGPLSSTPVSPTPEAMPSGSNPRFSTRPPRLYEAWPKSMNTSPALPTQPSTLQPSKSPFLIWAKAVPTTPGGCGEESIKKHT